MLTLFACHLCDLINRSLAQCTGGSIMPMHLSDDMWQEINNKLFKIALAGVIA
jgi:hypothetical protein